MSNDDWRSYFKQKAATDNQRTASEAEKARTVEAKRRAVEDANAQLLAVVVNPTLEKIASEAAGPPFHCSVQREMGPADARYIDGPIREVILSASIDGKPLTIRFAPLRAPEPGVAFSVVNPTTGQPSASSLAPEKVTAERINAMVRKVFDDTFKAANF